MDIWSVDVDIPFLNDNPCMFKNKGAVCRKTPDQLIDYNSLCEADWTFWDGETAI